MRTFAERSVLADGGRDVGLLPLVTLSDLELHTLQQFQIHIPRKITSYKNKLECRPTYGLRNRC